MLPPSFRFYIKLCSESKALTYFQNSKPNEYAGDLHLQRMISDFDSSRADIIEASMTYRHSSARLLRVMYSFVIPAIFATHPDEMGVIQAAFGKAVIAPQHRYLCVETGMCHRASPLVYGRA